MKLLKFFSRTIRGISKDGTMKFYILVGSFIYLFEANSILNTILLCFYTRKKKIENLFYWIITLICPAFLTTIVCFRTSTGLISIY